MDSNIGGNLKVKTTFGKLFCLFRGIHCFIFVGNGEIYDGALVLLNALFKGGTKWTGLKNKFFFFF